MRTRRQPVSAAALAQGKSLNEYSYEAGVTINTTRTHLNRMFTKVGVSRQQDLMKVLLSLVPDHNRLGNR